MIEHNNRNIAKKHAEYITGEELRRYCARKIRNYLPGKISVFDGAVGSGQLEQYLEADFIYGIDVQEEAIEAFKQNFTDTESFVGSFFNFKKSIICDLVLMNPPFSLRFKDLSGEEQRNIQEEFPWKKSGVIDDVFVLKSLKHSKCYGFYIMFPGVAYRSTEKKFRELIGTKLLELNLIENAFDDTQISVLFVVIDKDKADQNILGEIYDCKTRTVKHRTCFELDESCDWETPREPVEKEEIDIAALEAEIKRLTVSNRRKLNEWDRLVCEHFHEKPATNSKQMSLSDLGGNSP